MKHSILSIISGLAMILIAARQSEKESEYFRKIGELR